MKEPLIILGFGGNAIDFFDTVSTKYDIIGFVDDDEKKANLQYNGVGVFKRNFINENPSARIISMIGSEVTYPIRHEMIGKFGIPDNRFATVVHPAATVSASAKLGFDVVVMSGVVITSNAVIGNHIFLLANSSIHHDVTIGDFTMLGSGVTLAGHVKIGRNCFIGSASSVKSYTSVGDFSMVGMGSNVVKNIDARSVVMGNPAKPRL